jgi:uncharacterized protein (DUF2235 family)
MKNIIVCSDGTGNTAIKGRGTNVFKLFEAVDFNGHRTDPALDPQIAFYDDGVGTEDFKPLKVLGGAAGVGLARNVRQLYRELARVYDPDDRIFLFGFSRGAFTVRTLAGMIAACGLVDGTRLDTTHDLHRAVYRAYRAYRAGYGSVLTRLGGRIMGGADRPTAVKQLQATYPVHFPLKMTFLGVWDTVDAVGMPFALGDFVNRVIYQFKFPTQTLSEHVQRACQALSVDDDRVSFAPVLWTEQPGGDPRILQVWFAGAHSNVGGGYPKQGMSLVALDWMLRYAAEAGLRLQPLDVELYRGHATVDDKLYDPRAGLGIFYRWAPRDITRYCRASNVTPRIHLSVAERIAHGTDDYAPGNLPPDIEVAITPTGDGEADGPTRRRAEAVQRVIREAYVGRRPLLADVRPAIGVAELSYWLFIAAWLGLLIAAVGATTGVAGLTLGGVLKGAVHLVKALLTLDLGELWRTLGALWSSRWRLTLFAAVVGFGLAWFLSRRADVRMADTFSRFWHRQQPKLREALKQARKEAAAKAAPGR